MTQKCPNCGKVHDTSVFVSGQKLTCSCGIAFEVRRSDVTGSPSSINVTVNARPRSDRERVPPGEAPAAEPNGLDKTISSSRHVSTDAQPVLPVVPGYEFVELLGRGGMGEVWKAKQLSLGRIVAMKILPEKFSRDAEFVARFEKEANALASLSHPNIVQIIDRGQADGRYFFTMELVPGINLREMMNGSRLSVTDALRIMVQVARGIDSAHEQKIVHRDLKPENVLVDPRGHIKIADFGLAGMQGNDKNIALTATAVAMGTLNYMAPEQRRDARNVDARADLYSLGVMLYESLTGEVPMGRFKLPSQKVSGLDPRLDEIVAQLLEAEPEARPQRARDVAQALEPLISTSQIPGAAANSGTGSAVRAPLAGNAPQVSVKAVAALLVGLAVFGAVLKLWPAGDANVTRAPAWYADSDDELFSTVTAEGDRLTFGFVASDQDAGEELNVHSGQWRLNNGALTSVQYGDATDVESHPSLKPRAYVAHRYYAADDFEAEADLQLSDLSKEFPLTDDKAQHYAEVAFRIKDLQVSILAIPRVGMRLSWRYFTPEGEEIAGNSARDIENMTEDEMRVPGGRFHVRLSMKKTRAGLIDVEASANGLRFARKTLPFAGQVAKVALGCRNLACSFENLTVRGKAMPRPTLKNAASGD